MDGESAEIARARARTLTVSKPLPRRAAAADVAIGWQFARALAAAVAADTHFPCKGSRVTGRP